MANLQNHAYPTLGNRRIKDIKRKDIKFLFDKLNASMRQKSLHSLRVPLNMIYQHALEQEVVDVNPVSGISLSRAAKVKVRPLDRQQQIDLLEQAKVYREGMFHPHLLTLLRTGVRIGELCGLKWTDMDFTEHFLEVSRTRTSGVVSSTKNKLNRSVDMSAQLVEVLKELKREKQKEALKTGRSFSEWVFSQENGKPLSEAVVHRALRRCLEKAELPKMRVHDFRHTYATTRLLMGHEISDVSSQLGHSSISITFDTYTHWIPGTFKSQVDDLDFAKKRHPGASRANASKNLGAI